MKWLWVVLVVIGWAALAMAQAFTVGRIEVAGNTRIPAKEILAAVGFEAGQQVTREEVLAAVQAIGKLGYFTQVTPEVAFEEEVVVVRFSVTEYPRIERIVFEGLPPTPKGKGTLLSWLQEALRAEKRPNESKLQEVVRDSGVRTGEVLNAVRLEAAVAAVVEQYREMDLATVQVLPDLRGAELVFEIQELVVVGHRFRGLFTVPEEEAARLVTVAVGMVGKVSEIQGSLGALNRSAFFASGGISAELGDEGLWLVWDLEERVVLPVPVPLLGVDLVGVTAFPAEQMKARIGRLPGGLATNYDVLRALGPVYDYYRREGFFMAELVGEGVEEGFLKVLLKEGRISRIEVAGDTRTPGWVVERVMGLHPGQFLTEGRRAAGRQALMVLGYFQDVSLEPRWAADDLILKVAVTDLDKLGSITGNVALSPEEGIVGNAGYSQKNLLGRAIDLDLSFRRGLIGGGGTAWGLSFSTRSFPVFSRLSLDLYRNQEGFDPVTTTMGGEVAVAHPLAPYLSLSVGVGSELAWQSTEGEDLEQEVEALEPRTWFRIGVGYDDRDALSFPRTGSRGQIAVEKAGTFAPGVEYLALSAELAGFSPLDLAILFGEARAVLARRVGVRWGWDAPERYWFTLGGVDSVRGAKGVSTDRYGLLNSEFRVEIAPGAWVSVFGDLGVIGGGAVKASVGLELAANVAGMFVRLVLAWPNDRDATWVPEFGFSMSPMF